jgi:hypothetical protein
MAAHAEGSGTQAIGIYAHAEGQNTTASNASAHAEGNNTQATNAAAHSEGLNTVSSGTASHAEGLGSTASGQGAHAEGGSNVASATYAHAEGYSTIANAPLLHTSGSYNVEDPLLPSWVANHEYAIGDRVKYQPSNTMNGYLCTEAHTSGSLFDSTKWLLLPTQGMNAVIVGNGDSSLTRSNAYALDWAGNGYFNGDVYVNCSSDSTDGTKVITTSDLSTLAPKADPAFTGSIKFLGCTASGYNSLALGGGTTAEGNQAVALGGGTLAHGNYSIAGGGGS